ncbi:unnamed protein product [Prorocentrum cordatum]|uniref:Mei2-like C-terminal RNA recognition motif domain-containing protein n=1 Tax=Prorocentrum cordatum TaxID=2364126 RepID=A0ABN9UFH4_9DINO|nr:unnamed protein product [Polarella glacialis]
MRGATTDARRLAADLAAQLPPGLPFALVNLCIPFTLVCALSSFYMGPVALTLVVLLVLAQGAVASEVLGRHKAVPWLLLFWVSSVIGALYVGSRNYHLVYAPYKLASKGRDKIVPANASASGLRDGRTLTFDASFLLDGERSVGVRAFGATYCAAPVVSVTTASALNDYPKVQIWAVGQGPPRDRESTAPLLLGRRTPSPHGVAPRSPAAALCMGPPAQEAETPSHARSRSPRSSRCTGRLALRSTDWEIRTIPLLLLGAVHMLCVVVCHAVHSARGRIHHVSFAWLRRVLGRVDLIQPLPGIGDAKASARCSRHLRSAQRLSRPLEVALSGASAAAPCAEMPLRRRPARPARAAERGTRAPGGPITTLMLRNLPQKYTPDVLLKEVKEVLGSKVSFNFLHLPWDAPGRCNAGFAFINCCDVEGVQACRTLFEDYLFRRGTRNKACKVFVAHIQGLENNLIHLMGTAVAASSTHDPVIFWQGQRLRLKQAPAGAVPAPRSAPPRAPPSAELPARPAWPWLPPKPASGRPGAMASVRGVNVAVDWKGWFQADLEQHFELRRTACSDADYGHMQSTLQADHDGTHHFLTTRRGEGSPDDEFTRVLAAASLARRVRDIMRAKGIRVPGAPTSEGMGGAASPAQLFVGDGQDSSVRALRPEVQPTSLAVSTDWPAVSQSWPCPGPGHSAAGHGCGDEAPRWEWQSPVSHAALGARRLDLGVPAMERGPLAHPGTTRVLESDRDLVADAHRKFFQKFGSGEAVGPVARGPCGGGGGASASFGAQEANPASYFVVTL